MGVHLDIYLLAEFQDSSPDFNLTDRTWMRSVLEVLLLMMMKMFPPLLVRVMWIWMISGEPEWRISVEDQCLHVTSISYLLVSR